MSLLVIKSCKCLITHRAIIKRRLVIITLLVDNMRKFKRASYKKTHQKSYDCLKCHRSFQTKKRLNNHQWSCAVAKPVYSCPVCDKAFTLLDNQQRHTRPCPSRKRKRESFSGYTCRRCGEVFSNRADLYQYATDQR